MNIKKSILKVFSANFFQLISGIIVGFIVPSILTIDGYAELKTYTLCMSYIGLLHFGFLDGLYIKYGGKNYKEIDKGILKGEHLFIIVFQFFISIILLFISIFSKNIIIFLVSISILPVMVQTFHKQINQATGNFNRYSKIIYVYTLTYTVLNVVLAIFFRSNNYLLYCMVTCVSYLISVIIFEINFMKELNGVKIIINKNILMNIKVGYLVLLGNLAVIGFFGIDKWFVKLFLSTEDFAYYSFAVSMLNIINTLVNAISVTFYNYLFDNKNYQKINRLKEYLLVLGGFASTAFFVLSYIVSIFVTKYVPSLNIIAITFAVFPYMIVINALYVNLYKVYKNERRYFKVVIMMLSISIIYNVVALLLFHTTTSVAYATILTLLTWLIFSSNDLVDVSNDIKMYRYVLPISIVFLLSARFLNWYIGMITYMVFFIIWTKYNYEYVFLELKDTIIDLFKSKRKSMIIKRKE